MSHEYLASDQGGRGWEWHPHLPPGYTGHEWIGYNNLNIFSKSLFRCDRRLDGGGLRTRLSDTSSVIDLDYETHHHSDWFVN